jgi:hypothetical protein
VTRRLPTHLAVAALLRRMNDSGGMAMVRASGDPQTGAVLVLIDEGRQVRALERMRGLDDRDSMVPAGPTGGIESEVESYWRQRRARDPDLWVIELTGAGAERFVAETICAN